MNTCLKIASSAALALSLMMTTAVAEDEAATHRLGEAWKSALAGQEPVLTPKQFAMLNNLAYQSAATRVCEGLEIDAAKFSTQFGEATAPGNAGLSDEDAALHHTFVLIEFGTRYGLFIAEGEAQDKSFCANAAELKTKTDIPNIWE